MGKHKREREEKERKQSRRKSLFLVTTGILATLVGGIYHSIKDSDEIEFVEHFLNDPYQKVRTASDEEKQDFLNNAFEEANPRYLSEIKYDPSSIHARDHLEEMVKEAGFRITPQRKREIEKQVQGVDHLLYVLGELHLTGNGKKRPVFGKRELFTDEKIKCKRDIISMLYHEDVHGAQEAKGFQFGDIQVTSKELIPAIKRNEIRTQVLMGLNEIPAYAKQLELAYSGEAPISEEHFNSTKTVFQRVYSIFEKGLERGTLKPLERKYASEVLKEFKDLNEKLN